MNFLILLCLFLPFTLSISLWEARLVEQKARQKAEGPHPIVQDPAASAPEVVVTETGRVFVVKGTGPTRSPTPLEKLAPRRRDAWQTSPLLV